MQMVAAVPGTAATICIYGKKNRQPCKLPARKAPRRALAIAALGVGMMIWGSSFAVTKASLAQVPPITFAFIRFSIASLALLIMAVVQRRRAGAAAAPAPGWRSVALIGLSGVTLYYV